MKGIGGLCLIRRGGPAFGVFLLALAVILGGCSNGQATEGAKQGPAAAASATSAAGEASPDASSAAPGVPVRVMPIVPKDFVEYGEYYGTASPVREATLQTETGGRVDAVLASPGDAVHSGQGLARIDAERARSLFDTAVLNEQIARRDFEVKRKLSKTGHAADVVVDQAHLAWLQSQTAVIDARRVLEGALAVSPIDGIVVARYIEPYAQLKPGASTFAVADTTGMKVRVGVPEADIAGVRELYSAEVRIASLPGRVWQGRPVSIARQPSEGSRTYEVEILVDNSDGRILSGTTATVRLGLRELKDQVVVPTSALRSEGDLTYVMVANSPTVRRKKVETGPSSLTETVVLRGLSAGEELIVEGVNQVRDGDRVAARN